MKTKELAHWMRQEHEKVHTLSEKLQEKAAICPRTNQGRWIQDVRQAFDHLRAHLIKHMALEEQDGYMLCVVEQRPALSREVERLASEHAALAHLMDEIHRELGDLRPEDHLLILDCCRRIQNLLQYVERHERDENLLVLTAFTNDIGTKD